MVRYPVSVLLHWYVFITITYSALPQIRRLFQNEFSTECDTLLPPFNFQYPLVSLLLLPRFPVNSIILALFSITCFRRRFLHIQLALLYFIVSACRMFLFCLIVRDTSSYLTRSFQLFFSIIPKYYILKISKYFWFFLKVFRNTISRKINNEIAKQQLTQPDSHPNSVNARPARKQYQQGVSPSLNIFNMSTI